MIFSANTGATLAQAGMSSASGRCHTFDARADGYARAEACCVALLGEDGISDGISGSEVAGGADSGLQKYQAVEQFAKTEYYYRF